MGQAAATLRNYLSNNKEAIVTKWFQFLLGVYPPETVKNFQRKNQFTNPIGHNFHQGLSEIFDELINDFRLGELQGHLDRILRILAVQNVAPSRAIGFIFMFKRILREEVKNIQNGSSNYYEELYQLEIKIDELALLAFDVYVSCRESIYQLRLDETNKRYEILEKLNLAEHKAELSEE